ncbi:MAG TPA: hypothetical protein VFU37_18350, partial [Pyrinomonadaceae bacterium]|nr:hypothetical protein [Pyrinomonadaceae bacterium]
MLPKKLPSVLTIESGLKPAWLRPLWESRASQTAEVAAFPASQVALASEALRRSLTLISRARLLRADRSIPQATRRWRWTHYAVAHVHVVLRFLLPNSII